MIDHGGEWLVIVYPVGKVMAGPQSEKEHPSSLLFPKQLLFSFPKAGCRLLWIH